VKHHPQEQQAESKSRMHSQLLLNIFNESTTHHTGAADPLLIEDLQAHTALVSTTFPLPAYAIEARCTLLEFPLELGNRRRNCAKHADLSMFPRVVDDVDFMYETSIADASGVRVADFMS